MHKLWRLASALVLLCTLAPSRADGNIGCLFSGSLCTEEVEWCYDDFAFGRCIPIYENEQQDQSLFHRYNMNNGDLKWFEDEIQDLVARGYRWEHAYTQCLLQSMLYTLQQQLDPSEVDTKICEPFVDPSIITNTADNDENAETDSDETAFVRFTPNSPLIDTDYANEVYNPPLVIDAPIDDLGNAIMEAEDFGDPKKNIHDVVLIRDDESPIAPFVGFRERIQAEQAKEQEPEILEAEKKSFIPNSDGMPQSDNDESEAERLGARWRKYKNKITVEYLKNNRLEPLDAEIITNAIEKYKQSFAAKNFPFEYENADELSDSTLYDEEKQPDELGLDTNIEESIGTKDLNSGISRHTPPRVLQDLINNYWKLVFQSKPNDKGTPFYAEGGPLKSTDLEGEKTHFYSEELPELFYNDFGFKRRERDDVKKPGPRIDAKLLKILIQQNVTAASSNEEIHKLANTVGGHSHEELEDNPSYTYILFKNRFGADREKSIEFIHKLEHLMGLDKNTFTNPHFDLGEVVFKVERNSKGLNAEDVAKRIDTYKNELRRQTGAQIKSAGVGERAKDPPGKSTFLGGAMFMGMEIPAVLALVGSLAVLLVGSGIFALLLRRDMDVKRKFQGLVSAAEIDAEATRDYQELCRARMSGKWTGQGTTGQPSGPPDSQQRITSLSKEGDNNSPSTRSSTSSWSEEPALTNMDISTGHMVLAYMEDHLHNKDRLEQEWQALCAYEAEPSATTAALRPENKGKNRGEVLPYDHSRVTLNTLTNHLGSDYINASTITDHDPRNPAYIAASGPLQHTAADFWQLVWEQGSVVMVMLTRLSEGGTQLCHRYWPEEGSELYHIYEVHLVSEHIWCDDYLVRSFYLKNQRTAETRTVTQFHFLSWPENGVPASAKALLEFRRKVNKSYRGRSCPIVVHCSDGAGRSGTYCLIDMVLNRMAKGAKEIDIAATLEHIRDQRPRTVATRQQFEFVLTAVAAEVHAILKAHTAHMQQVQEKKEKDKEGTDKEKPNN